MEQADARPGQRLHRHVVITGASSGIGAALALRYAQTSTRLTLIARNAANLAAMAMQCQEAGCETIWLAIDIRNGLEMREALERLDSEHSIDIVFANAGLGGRRAMVGPLGEIAGDAAEIAAVNFSGTIHTIAPLVPRFASRRAGHVVIVSSVAAIMPMPLSPTYAASKAGVASYAANLRAFLRPSGVPVTLVTPGFVETRMSAEIAGPKPFMISAEKAADLMYEAVARRAAHLRFPWQLHLLAWAARFAPAFVIDFAVVHWRRKSQ